MSAKNKRSLDFEINLLPFISVLAVCISFLLLTAVWVQVGTFSLSQALGTEKSESSDEKNKMTLWIQFENNGSVRVSVKEGEQLKTSLRFAEFNSMSSKSDLRQLEKYVNKVKSASPDLQTALLLPAANSSYEDMVLVMDSLKQHKIRDIGIAPL